MSLHHHAAAPSPVPAVFLSGRTLPRERLAGAAPDDAAPVPTSPMSTGIPLCGLTTHEHIGFELGWDYAHYRLQPPAPYGQDASALRNGLLAGQAVFGLRTLQPGRAVRKWLQLRLHAWLRGRSVELFQVTPRYLEQIDVAHCPVTRVALTVGHLEDSDASVDRVRNDAGYAAGNLAVMSSRANQAKGTHGFESAMRVVRQIEDRPVLDIGGVGAAGWKRIAILCSFVEAIPHDEAATLPLLVLPPRRLHLLNPVQALQAVISRQLMRPGWAERSRRFEALLPGKPLRRAYQGFFLALLPRVLEAVPPVVRQARSDDDARRLRWAIEDAWQNPLVLRRWTSFARLLDADGCEALLARVNTLNLGPERTAAMSEDQATEGWNLDSRGYVPHATLMRRSPRVRPVLLDAADGAPSPMGRALAAPEVDRQVCLPI